MKVQLISKASFYIFISIILIIISLFLFKPGSSTFHTLEPYKLSSLAVSEDEPANLPWLIDNIVNFGSIYLKHSLFPIYLVLLPGILLMAAGISILKENKPVSPDLFNDRRQENLFLLSVFIAVFVITLIIYFFVFLQTPLFEDEFSYLFQSEILANGKLYAQSPPCLQFFTKPHIINNGKWYSKYTIGWPLLLVPGVLIGFPIIIPALFSAGGLILIYYLVKEISNKSLTAVIAVFLTLFSPFYLLEGDTFFTHTPSAFFILLCLLCILKLRGENSFKYAVTGGLAAGMAVFIRPGDTVIVLMGMLPLIAYIIMETKEKTEKLKYLTVSSLMFFLVMGILLWTNKVQNGSPFLLGFNVYDPFDKIGFGVVEHTPIKGVWNLLLSSFLMAFWTVPLTSLGLFPGLFRKNKISLLLLIPALLVPIFYFFFFSLGAVGFGARYYFLEFLLLIPLTAEGLVFIDEKLSAKPKFCPNSFITAFIIITGCFSLTGIFPLTLQRIKSEAMELKSSKAPVKYINVPRMSLLFVEDWSPFRRSLYHPFREERILPVLFLTPEDNRELINALADRKPYILTKAPSGKLIAVPYPKDDNPLKVPMIYTLAGLNYKFQTLYLERAEKSLKKAAELSGNKPQFLYNLAFFYEKNRDYEKAEEVFKEILGKDPNFAPAYFFLGVCQAKTWKESQAKEAFEKFLSMSPPASLADKAKKWLRELNR